MTDDLSQKPQATVQQPQQPQQPEQPEQSQQSQQSEQTQQPSKNDELRRLVVEMIQSIFDPEIPVNIWELGLIYELDVQTDGKIKVVMTLTSPNCPVATTLPPEVEGKIRAVDGVTDVDLEVTWDPPWSPERMSEAAKLELGFF